MFFFKEIVMNTKTFVIATLSALAMGVSVPLMAEPAGADAAQVMGQHPGAGMAEPMMSGAMKRGEGGHGSMAGGGMGGMSGAGGGMMGAMMGAGAHLNPATAMRMHGEMMRAMGDILIKYADQAGAGAGAKQ